MTAIGDARRNLILRCIFTVGPQLIDLIAPEHPMSAKFLLVPPDS